MLKVLLNTDQSTSLETNMHFGGIFFGITVVM